MIEKSVIKKKCNETKNKHLCRLSDIFFRDIKAFFNETMQNPIPTQYKGTSEEEEGAYRASLKKKKGTAGQTSTF